MALGPNDLVLGYMSMTRVESLSSFVSASFADRCTAAAAGGFAAIGIVPSVYEDARATGHSDPDMRAMLQNADLVVTEVEVEVPGIVGPSTLDVLAKELGRALEVADVFDAERVFVVGAPGVSVNDLAETFRWVCDRCAEHNRVVALEFMDMPSLSGLADARTALQVVQAAGRDNGGLKVDVYHHINGANDWSQLESLPGECVKAIEFSDMAIPRVSEDYLEDTLHHRRAPGEGDADLVRFVQTMDAIGATCPYTLEVISDEIAKLPPAELGERLGTTTRRVLQAARA